MALLLGSSALVAGALAALRGHRQVTEPGADDALPRMCTDTRLVRGIVCACMCFDVLMAQVTAVIAHVGPSY